VDFFGSSEKDTRFDLGSIDFFIGLNPMRTGDILMWKPYISPVIYIYIYTEPSYIYIYLSIYLSIYIYGSCWLYVDYMFVKYWIILTILDYVGDIGLWWSYYHIGLCWVILGGIGLNCYSIEKHIINIKQLDWGIGGIFSGIFYPNILGGITGIYTCM